ncbi:ATP-dependent DNA ligase [Herbiconiux sp.]|uniref:DUF7882 family protein n=1 Tax=Herbiconiux sp. TaxID=1871186 RepID=UPI0025C4AB79|nr:ATP-dependent DNA ligase [Herbiconiux sp.]
MGKFIYGAGGLEIELDDRTLAHVKVAMFSKLRRNESFSFSWQVDLEGGSGRHSIWISPASLIHFHFFGNRPPALNRSWIRQMVTAANDGDLRLTAEPAEADTPGDPSRGRW